MSKPDYIILLGKYKFVLSFKTQHFHITRGAMRCIAPLVKRKVNLIIRRAGVNGINGDLML